MSLPPELEEQRIRVQKIAREVGLDFFDTIFLLVEYPQMCELAAFEGFPRRYPHWRFGMEFERHHKLHGYGLAKIYELVINNDPCYAYLLEGNSLMEQKLVMGHVMAHCDFFKNNAYFRHTNRKMVDGMANHGVRVERYMDIYGVDRVERYIDHCLSIDNLIDPYQFTDTVMTPTHGGLHGNAHDPRSELEVPRLKSEKSYLEDWINPPEMIKAERQAREAAQLERPRFPAQPERGIMAFLMEYAPLERWERHVMGMLRQESLYYVPQRQTKIMNEGWASYWHSKLMTEHLADSNEILDFAETHSATMAMPPGQINPYKIGLEVFRDIEDRWNRGQFGPEWDSCDDMHTRENWNRHLELGRDKIFEVRRVHNDVTFIDAFLTPELMDRLKMYNYSYDQKRGQWVIESRDCTRVKESMLFQLTNYGQPIILIEDANYRNRGELLLVHKHDQVGLDKKYARRTLENLAALWKRPIHVRTIDHRGKTIVWSHDGDKFGAENNAASA
jgi:stage V sporulation protein R